MSSSVRQRLFKSFAAQGFAQVVNIMIQVCNVPLFLHFWGKGLYGEWILLSTIPTYLTLSDFGFGTAAATDMTLRTARGDKEGAVAVYQSVWLLITSLSLLATLAIIGFVHFFPLTKLFNLSNISGFEAVNIVILLTMQVFVALQQGLLGAGFRCDGNYAWGVTVANFQRLAEFLAGAIVISMGGKPIALATAVLIVGAVSNALIRWSLYRRSPWIIFGWSHGNWETLKKIAGPAFAYMGFPIGHALSLQGVVMVIGIVLNPSAVVVFSTTRTLTRFIWQILNIIASTTCVELSVALSAGNYKLARSLHQRACQASMWLAVFFGTALYFSGGYIYKIWTKGRLPYDHVLFGILIFVVISNTLWSTSYAVPMAINKHQRVAAVYVLATGASLVFSAFMTRFFGLNGTAVSLLVIDVVMNFYVLRSSMIILEENLRDFLQALFKTPLRQLPA